MFKISYRAFLFGVMGVLALSLPALPRSVYTAPVGKFRDAAGVVIEATKTYVSQLNKIERDRYIYAQASAALPIKIQEIEGTEIFSKRAIAARIGALEQLANYTNLLYRLANSTEPESVVTEANDLQTAFTSLTGTVAGLSGRDDTQFQSLAAQVLPSLGQVLRMFAERRTETALKQAVALGAEPMNDLIDVIGRDVRFAYERKRNQYSWLRVSAVDDYNREFEKGKVADPAKLKALAEAVSAAEDRWEALSMGTPAEGLQAMKEANLALMRFVRTQRPTSADYVVFSESIEAFASTARRVGQTALEIKGGTVTK